MAQPAPERAQERTLVDGVTVLGALSPSRAGDFKTCALRYRFRTLDRLPEVPSPDVVRGTVVHKVLEDLFDLPADERTPERAEAMVSAAWAHVQEAEPRAGDLFRSGDEPEGSPVVPTAAWLDSCRQVLRRYFDLEDPRRLEPAAREVYVETLLDSQFLLRGIVDRVDVARDGAIRVVDYKTGPAPAPGFEARALFQMRFYALVIWRTRGVVPASYEPDAEDLRATERQLEALARAIALAHETGEWLPRPGGHCAWCSFRALCPEFGGTPPPLPTEADESATLDLLDELTEPVQVETLE